MSELKAQDICRALHNARFRYHNEKELQEGVGRILTGLHLEYDPEHVLGPRDRIDFLVGAATGIECKSEDSSGGTSLASVTRQLMRYAHSEEIEELILLTTMSKHKNLPNEMNSKPLYVVHLMSFL